jgi:starvation-inducible DNA-binding protein
MSNLNQIGLDKEKSKAIILHLNELLADYSIFYQNTRGFHWNIKGDKFFELHDKFEDLYGDLYNSIDEIAERIKMLGGIPNHNFTDYAKVTSIKESGLVSDGKKAVEEILEAFKIILAKQRNILEASAQADDEGTNALMSDYISKQEKLVWMYSSFLGI